jgi:hypothetical protein
MAKTEEPQGLTLNDLIVALQALKGNDDESLKKRAQYEAEAHQRLTKRENDPAPGVSVYNPKGERDFPKPDLKCKMLWVGFPLQKDQLTPQEVDLLNRIDTIGDFPFHRADGSLDTCSISGERDANGKWTQIAFSFRCKGDDRHNLPTMTAMLREILGLGTVEDELKQRIAELEAIVA